MSCSQAAWLLYIQSIIVFYFTHLSLDPLCPLISVWSIKPLPPIERESVFPTAQDPSGSKYAAAVANLTSMFHQLGQEKVEEVLHLNEGRVEAAVDMLLAMTTTDTPSTASRKPGLGCDCGNVIVVGCQDWSVC